MGRNIGVKMIRSRRVHIKKSYLDRKLQPGHMNANDYAICLWPLPSFEALSNPIFRFII
jgi:hypothetical protein